LREKEDIGHRDLFWPTQLFRQTLVSMPIVRDDRAIMPRTARASVGGYCYHVLNRGNARA
jgi:hypothetical protein